MNLLRIWWLLISSFQNLNFQSEVNTSNKILTVNADGLQCGCGSVGRVVASNSRGTRFESGHRHKFILNIYGQVNWKDENKEKEAGNGPFKKHPQNKYQALSGKIFKKNCQCGETSSSSGNIGQQHDGLNENNFLDFPLFSSFLPFCPNQFYQMFTASISQPVLSKLAKFRHFGKIFLVLGSVWGFT